MDHDHTPNSVPPCDPLTIAAIGLLAGALTDLIHEGLGHGGACLLVGGKPTLPDLDELRWGPKRAPARDAQNHLRRRNVCEFAGGRARPGQFATPAVRGASSPLFSVAVCRLKPVCRHGLLFVFRNEQYWRLGKRDCGPAGFLALARIVGCAGGTKLFPLRPNDAGQGRASNEKVRRFVTAAPICLC